MTEEQRYLAKAKTYVDHHPPGTDVGNTILIPIGSENYMLKRDYDVNNNGIVDTADSIPWSKVTGKPPPIPGPPGTAATINVGSTKTGAPGTCATITNSGSAVNAVFNFTIPRGSMWFMGPKDPPAVIAGSLPGDAYLNTLSGDIFTIN